MLLSEAAFEFKSNLFFKNQLVGPRKGVGISVFGRTGYTGSGFWTLDLQNQVDGSVHDSREEICQHCVI